MPRTRKTGDNAVVVALSSFTTAAVPGSTVVAAGTRLRADNPIVRAVPHMFTADGASAEELQAARRALYADAYADIERERAAHKPAPPKPVRPEDQLVAIRNTGHYLKSTKGLTLDGSSLSVATGDRVAKSHPVAKARPQDFVPVVPPGLERKDALEALQFMSNLDEDGQVSYRVYAGTWVSRSHPAAVANPEMFQAVR
jgi:hypothetical protein